MVCNARRGAGVGEVEDARSAFGRQGEQGLEFEEFFRAEYPNLVRGLFLLTADRGEAEELAQEAMARACARWDRVAGMDSPGGYVYRTAVNLNRKRLRHLAIRARRLLSLGQEAHAPPAAEARVELAAALESLRPLLREAFMLVEWFGLSMEEAGTILGVKAVSVRSRVHRARAELRRALREDVETRG